MPAPKSNDFAHNERTFFTESTDCALGYVNSSLRQFICETRPGLIASTGTPRIQGGFVFCDHLLIFSSNYARDYFLKLCAYYSDGKVSMIVKTYLYSVGLKRHRRKLRQHWFP